MNILYFLNTAVILGVFLTMLGFLRTHYLELDLAGKFTAGMDERAVIDIVNTDLQQAASLLAGLALIAIGVLNYFFVRLTLQPIRTFVEAQRRFISDASHELRTPLATVKTENEVALLAPEHITRESAVALLQSNVEEIDRISTILNNLLNLASFKSATGAPPFSAVNLSAVATRVLDRLRLVAERKKIRLTAAKPDTVFIWGNATAMEEVILNLIKNAIQYTPPDGEIQLIIHTDPEEDVAELVVRDSGVGIAPKDLPYIFEPFYRSENSLHMHQQGTGLGLPLVREIVKRHRGGIHVDSLPGKGTSVVVKLPLAPEDSARPKVSPA